MSTWPTTSTRTAPPSTGRRSPPPPGTSSRSSRPPRATTTRTPTTVLTWRRRRRQACTPPGTISPSPTSATASARPTTPSRTAATLPTDTLPLALDIEYNPYGAECYGLSPAQMVAWLSAFTGEAQRLTGQSPFIYTTADWWSTCTGDSTAFGSNQLWVAAYRSGSPEMPAGWGTWTFWQYTSRGSVPGIVGHADVSYLLSAAVRLLDPGDQQSAAGDAIQLQVSSLNAAAGQSPQFTASGMPPGPSISTGGLITGTITAAGSYRVTVSAAYSSGVAGSLTFTWTVTSRQPSPLPTTAGPTPTTPSPAPTPTPTDPSPNPTAPSSPPPSSAPSESPASPTDSSPPATSSSAPPSGS
ncbi:hypothetical protein EAS64_11035 [Trebonia kvetii]|uniref:Uncharacterized protein n=1 Tax=Trebonia kvetii TaxID=2480626 RepID=A0A6P2C4P2_9ACTN|nr:hypothetical protein EAS64_11035 [Trebonia kvetii]